MKTEKYNSMKYLPGITATKPQLRNTSWAKLLSEHKSGKDGENGGRIAGLDVWCQPVLLNLKATRKTGKEPVGNLTSYVRRCSEDEHVEEPYEMEITMERKKPSQKLLDKNIETPNAKKCINDGACYKDKTKETSRTTSDQDKTDTDHLPPLGDFYSVAKTTKETFSFPKNPKDQRGSIPRKNPDAIDWQKIFVNGGFRPRDSRDIPTRGEINLLKYKTWDPDDPMYHIAKCTKYFGLNSDKGKAEKLTLVDKEPPKLYSSPSPTCKFYPFQTLKRQKGTWLPMKATQDSLTHLKNPSKQHNLCNSCLVPPVTPASSMIRSSPFGWTPLPYMERRNTLDKLVELSVDGGTTDEGICSPTESELDL